MKSGTTIVVLAVPCVTPLSVKYEIILRCRTVIVHASMASADTAVCRAL